MQFAEKTNPRAAVRVLINQGEELEPFLARSVERFSFGPERLRLSKLRFQTGRYSLISLAEAVGTSLIGALRRLPVKLALEIVSLPQTASLEQGSKERVRA